MKILNKLDKMQFSQIIFSITLGVMLCFIGILNNVNAILNFMNINTTLDTAFCYCILISCVFLSIFCIIFFHKIKIDAIILVFFFLFVYFFGVLFSNQSEKLFFTEFIDYAENPFYILFVYAIPAYIIIRYLNNYPLFINIIKKICIFSLLTSVFVYFFIKDSFANQYMTLSYNALFQVLFLIIFRNKKFNIFEIILITLGSFVVTIGGARGALLSYLVIIFLYLLSNVSYNKNKTLKILSFITVFLIFIINLNFIIEKVNDLISAIGIYSRTLSFMNYEGDNFTSGRFDTYIKCIEHFNVFGHGLFYDRTMDIESYAHNIFLELILNYGLIIGVFIIFLIIFLLVKGFINSNLIEKKIILCLASTGFIMLLLSSSYLGQNPAFYALLGLCVNKFKIKLKD